MATRGLGLDWSYHTVQCTQCGTGIRRKLYNPSTGKPLSRFFCDFNCKAIWQRTQKPIDEVWLRQKYEIEGLRAPDIAKIVGRNSKQVWNWLKGYGIETHKRGHNPSIHFKIGERSCFSGKKHSDAAKEIMRQRRLSDGHFPKNPDGTPYWLGKTGDVHPQWKGGVTPERIAFYSTTEWKKAQKATYARAKGKCERCQNTERLHIHHVIPFAFKAHRCALQNLKVLCSDCHHFVHSRNNGDREYLPPYGIMYLVNGTDIKSISINYYPKCKAEIPTWMKSQQCVK